MKNFLNPTLCTADKVCTGLLTAAFCLTLAGCGGQAEPPKAPAPAEPEKPAVTESAPQAMPEKPAEPVPSAEPAPTEPAEETPESGGEAGERVRVETEVLGMQCFYEEEEAAPYFTVRTYYPVLTEGADAPAIAESFGFSIDDHSVDLDGDGVDELVCNVTFGGDGAVRVYVYRCKDGSVEKGTIGWHEEELEDLDLWGANATGEYYDPETGDFVLQYARKNSDEYGTHIYEYKDLAFEPFAELG